MRFLRPSTLLASRPAGGGDRYGVLLGLILASYLLSAFQGGVAVAVVRLLLYLITLLLALHTSRVRASTVRFVMLAAWAGTGAAVVLAFVAGSGTALGVVHLWIFLVLATTVLVIVRRVLSHRVVTMQTILGALSAYLIIGLSFAAFYSSVGELSGSRFFAETAAQDTNLMQYFSFTTLTTLGYGDLTPTTNLGRCVAVLEALIGQVFLVTLVARLVSLFRPSHDRNQPEDK